MAALSRCSHGPIAMTPADLDAVVRTERHLGQVLHERDVRLAVGAAGTLAGGRGMLLIGELPDDWGVTRRDDGKVVWARFSLRE